MQRVDATSCDGYCPTGSLSRGCRNYWRRRKKARNLACLMVEVGGLVEWGMIEASHLRGNLRTSRTRLIVSIPAVSVLDSTKCLLLYGI